MPQANRTLRELAQEGVRLEREITIQRAESDGSIVDPESRTVEIAFSSEEPVMRWGDIEILDHGDGSVRLDRMNNGAAFLLGHGDARDQIGVIESARVDSDRVGRALARFGNGPLAQEIMADVNDGIRRLVSVGYIVHQWQVTQNDNAPWEFRATDWEPVEASIVPVPADAKVGVGRDLSTTEETTVPKPATQAPDARNDGAAQDVQGGKDKTTTVDTRTDDEVLEQEARNLEVGRMRAIAKKFGCEDMAEQLIETDGTEDELKRAIRNEIVNRRPDPVPAANDVRISGGRPRYKGLRAFAAQGEEAAYRSGMWVRAALFHDDKARRWISEHGVRAGVEGISSKGGAIVPDELSQAIIDNREQYGIARRVCRVMPMMSDSLTVPRRTGGVTAQFVGENTEPTASDKAWDNVQLNAKKLGAQAKFSSEYAEDAIIDVAEDLAQELAYAFAETEDDCLFNGDGTSTYGGIRGIRTKIIDGTHGAGAVNAASNTDTFAEVAQVDLDSLMAVLPAYALPNAAWFCSQPCKALVFDALAAAAGGTTMMMLGERPMPAHLGYPIEVSQKMPVTTGDLSSAAMLLFGDLARAVTFGDRRGFRVRLLEERYAELDQLAIIGFERFDIVAHSLGDGTTAGPIVALIGN